MRKRIFISFTSIFLLGYFAFTSGLVYKATSGEISQIDTPYSIALQKDDGIVGLNTSNDIKCAKWLAENYDGAIYADYNGVALLLQYIPIEEFTNNNKVTWWFSDIISYVFLTEWDIENNKIVSGTTPGLRKYKQIPKLDGFEEVFSSGNAVVLFREIKDEEN